MEGIAYARAGAVPVDEVGREESPARTAEALRAMRPDVIVTDLAHGAMPAARLEAMHRALRGSPVAAFTAGVSDLPADIVIAPYVGAVAPVQRMAGRYLVGPRFFVLRGPVRDAMVHEREIAEGPPRVAVAIGGADPAGLSRTAVQGALDGGARSVRVVSGPAMIEGRIRALASDRVDIVTDAAMIDALLWADIAITGDGLLKYECAALGLPTIIARSPLTDTPLSAVFTQAGSARRSESSPATARELAGTVSTLAADREERRAMSHAGRRLVDGEGAQRIAAELGL